MSNLCIIPARGGSKRIPRKNIKKFLGKPIIAYSIELALESGLFNEVMVSTDDQEIAEIAIKYGANVPFFRSLKTSDDFATTFEVISEVMFYYQEKQNQLYDYVCCIYPTTPLTFCQNIKDGFNALVNNNFESVFPIVPFSYPVLRGLERNKNGLTKMIWPENINSRSQDLKQVYHDAGQWYWFNPKKIKNSLFTENSGSIILDEMRVQDIDNLTDWKLAELKYEILQSSK